MCFTMKLKISLIYYCLILVSTQEIFDKKPKTLNSCLERENKELENQNELLWNRIKQQDGVIEDQNRIIKSLKTRDCAANGNWVGFGNSCYYFSKVNANWDNAKELCRAMGANLANVLSSEEHNFLVERLKLQTLRSCGFWLGGSDTATEGTWIWSKNGNAFSFTSWRTGEPNGGREENCLEMRTRSDYMWADISCSLSCQFVCKTEK